MDVSVIVVNYNTRELLRNCLHSLFASSGELSPQVIVVDNGSSDGSAQAVREEFPAVRLLTSGTNLGFARANNLALAEARGECIFFINSDVVVEKEGLASLATFLEREPGAGLACGQLLNLDGTRQNSFSNFPTLATELLNKSLLRFLFPRHYPGKRQESKKAVEVEAVIGAFFAARRQAVAEVGPLDEDYFLFLEETDWSWRMKKAGWKVFFVPQARAFHLQGASANKDPLGARIEYYRSRYIYFKKHKGWPVELFLRSGLVARLVVNNLTLASGLLFTLGLCSSLRARLKIYLGLLWWHIRLCPSGSGLRC